MYNNVKQNTTSQIKHYLNRRKWTQLWTVISCDEHIKSIVDMLLIEYACDQS